MTWVARRAHVDAVMRRELRRVDGDTRAGAMRELRRFVDGGDKAGDVRCATHRDQADLAAAILERLLDSVEIDVALVSEADHHVTAAMAPRQKVGMVLHLGDEDLAAIESGFLRGNAVERVGRSLDKDHDLFDLLTA